METKATSTQEQAPAQAQTTAQVVKDEYAEFAYEQLGNDIINAFGSKSITGGYISPEELGLITGGTTPLGTYPIKERIAGGMSEEESTNFTELESKGTAEVLGKAIDMGIKEEKRLEYLRKDLEEEEKLNQQTSPIGKSPLMLEYKDPNKP